MNCKKCRYMNPGFLSMPNECGHPILSEPYIWVVKTYNKNPPEWCPLKSKNKI
ncbi:unnamed protein product, partial [marine sediment metagenome]